MFSKQGFFIDLFFQELLEITVIVRINNAKFSYYKKIKKKYPYKNIDFNNIRINKIIKNIFYKIKNELKTKSKNKYNRNIKILKKYFKNHLNCKIYIDNNFLVNNNNNITLFLNKLKNIHIYIKNKDDLINKNFLLNIYTYNNFFNNVEILANKIDRNINVFLNNNIFKTNNLEIENFDNFIVNKIKITRHVRIGFINSINLKNLILSKNIEYISFYNIEIKDLLLKNIEKIFFTNVALLNVKFKNINEVEIINVSQISKNNVENIIFNNCNYIYITVNRFNNLFVNNTKHIKISAYMIDTKKLAKKPLYNNLNVRKVYKKRFIIEDETLFEKNLNIKNLFSFLKNGMTFEVIFLIMFFDEELNHKCTCNNIILNILKIILYIIRKQLNISSIIIDIVDKNDPGIIFDNKIIAYINLLKKYNIITRKIDKYKKDVRLFLSEILNINDELNYNIIRELIYYANNELKISYKKIDKKTKLLINQF